MKNCPEAFTLELSTCNLLYAIAAFFLPSLTFCTSLKQTFCGSGSLISCRISLRQTFCGSGSWISCRTSLRQTFCGTGSLTSCRISSMPLFCAIDFSTFFREGFSSAIWMGSVSCKRGRGQLLRCCCHSLRRPQSNAIAQASSILNKVQLQVVIKKKLVKKRQANGRDFSIAPM